MPAAELKKRWQSGEVAYGATIKLGSPWMAEVLAPPLGAALCRPHAWCQTCASPPT